MVHTVTDTTTTAANHFDDPSTEPFAAPWDDEGPERPESAPSRPERSAPTGSRGAAAPTSAKSAHRKRPAKSASATRSAVLRTMAVAGLPDEHRELLAAILSAPDSDVVEVTVASIESEDQALPALRSVLEIATADALEAGVLATELAGDAVALRPAWKALSLLASLPAAAPPAQAKAGLAFARAAQDLGGTEMAALRSILALLEA